MTPSKKHCVWKTILTLEKDNVRGKNYTNSDIVGFLTLKGFYGDEFWAR
jgi:hypothetical protein